MISPVSNALGKDKACRLHMLLFVGRALGKASVQEQLKKGEKNPIHEWTHYFLKDQNQQKKIEVWWHPTIGRFAHLKMF